MPQFELNTPTRRTSPAKPHAFYGLSDFAKGYVEAMFFTNGDTGDEREALLNELGVERLTRASVAAIARDCDAFTGKFGPDGCFIQQWLDRSPDYTDAQAGRDFWFTRQGHGVGFQDREELTPEQAETLRGAAHAMGETYVECYRGWIHYRGA